MIFQPFYLGCLAHASYLVGDEGLCAIVDPQRDVDQYIDEARRRGLRIAHVIETHLHADFVSGHIELARATGARIHVGHGAGAAFPHVAAHDGDEIVMGHVRLRFLETPGHTPESMSVLVLDGHPPKLLTGDTLFVGDVGRPDLAGGRGYTAAQMAAMLWETLHVKLAALPDEVEIWPAHGAGSACGKSISNERFSTLGAQRRTNYALQPMTQERFVALMTADLGEPPAYFSRDAEINRQGAPALAELPQPLPFSPAEVERRMARSAGEDGPGRALVLDVRPAADFGVAHVPGSLWIGLSGQFAAWCGALLSFEQPIVLVAASPEQIAEARLRLARVGLHDVAGFLDGGVAAWAASGRVTAGLPTIEPAELAGRSGVSVLDVRRAPEHAGGHVPGAPNVPLHQLGRRLAEVTAARPLSVVCQSGYRSTIACSLLSRAGVAGPDGLLNVAGGTAAWIAAGLPVEGPATTPCAP